jgi:MFS family permease
MDRRLFITLYLTMMATSLGASIVLPLLPVYAAEMGATGFELGLIFSGFALSRAIVLPVVGSLADTWGRRKFMIWGLFLFMVLSIGYDLVRNVMELILCRVLQGAAAAMVIPVARAYVGEMTPVGQEGRMMGHFNMAFFGGLALGPWLGGFLKDIWGISSAFYAMGLLTFFGLALSLWTLPRTSRDLGAPLPARTSYLKLLKHPMILAVFVFRAGSILGLGMNWAFQPLYGHDVLHLSSSRIGLLLSVIVVMTTALQPVFGPLADRVSRTGMLALGGALASLGLMAVPFFKDFYSLLGINLLIGVASALYMPPLMAVTVDLGRETGEMNRVMSLLELAFSVGMVGGPLLAGVVKETFGLAAVFHWGGIMGIVASGVYLVMMARTKPRLAG